MSGGINALMKSAPILPLYVLLEEIGVSGPKVKTETSGISQEKSHGKRFTNNDGVKKFLLYGDQFTHFPLILD